MFSADFRLSQVTNVVKGVRKILCAALARYSPMASSFPVSSIGSASDHVAASTTSTTTTTTVPSFSSSCSSGKDATTPPVSAAMVLSPELPYEVAAELTKGAQKQQRGEGLKETKRVPATRAGRAAGFTTLFAKIAWDKVMGSTASEGLLSARSHGNIVETLCRMRGAVLKLGQMLSIQDEATVPGHITALFARVRDRAVAMPVSQLESVLRREFNRPAWREELFEFFQEAPIAAASIGQVHYARLRLDVLPPEERAARTLDHSTREGTPNSNNTNERIPVREVPKQRPEDTNHSPADNSGNTSSVERDTVEVAVKVQYPGVAQSIDADVANLRLLGRLHLFPPGIFVDNVLNEMRSELRTECQYTLEAAKQNRYRALLHTDPVLQRFFHVPYVFTSLSTDRVLVSEFVPGIPIDQLAKRGDIPRAFRSFLTEQMLRLTLKELFIWSFMQTDPNYANFLYDAQTNRVHLLDFGAARTFPLEFTRDYLDVVAAAARGDRGEIIRKSIALGFLCGREVAEMIDAHVESVMVLGKPFRDVTQPYDFTQENLPSQISAQVPTMLRLRLRPPPTLSYSLHRRLSGVILLASRLEAVAACGKIFWEIYEEAKEALAAAHVAVADVSSETTEAPDSASRPPRIRT